jgi:MFS family permease
MQVEIAAEKDAMRTHKPTNTETDTSTHKKTTSLLSGYMLRLVGIVCFTQFLQQFSGMNVLNNFSPKLYEALVSNPNMMGFVGNIVQLVATVPSALLVDRLGRRPLLIFGATFLALAWLVVGLLGILAFQHPEHCYKVVGCPVDAVCDDDARFTSQAMALDYVCGLPPVTVTNTTTSIPSTYAACAAAVDVTNSDSFNLDCLYTGDDGAPTAAQPYPYIAPAAGYAFIAMTYVVEFMYGMTLGPVIWSYNAEIAPVAYRAQIGGMSAASNLFFNAVVVSPVIGDLIAHIGFNTFWIFVVIMLGAIGFFYWIVETKDLPIEVVTELWEAKLHCQYLEHPDPTKIGEEIEDDVEDNDDAVVADDVGDDDKGSGDGDDMDNVDKENWA